MTNEERATQQREGEFRAGRHRSMKADYVAMHAHELLVFLAPASNAERYVKDAVELAGALYERIVRDYPEYER